MFLEYSLSELNRDALSVLSEEWQGRAVRFSHNYLDLAKLYSHIIDEDTDLTQSQKFFFDYHRHLGVDIYIITKSIQRMNKAIRNLVEIELRLVNLRIFGLSSVVVLKTVISGVVVKKSVLKYDPVIFVLYRSALVEHMKGVRGRPPVMLFVGLIVLFFSLYQLFGYFHRSGGVLPKVQAQVQQVENKSSNNEKSYPYYPYNEKSYYPSQRQPQPSGYYYIEVDTSAKEPLHEQEQEPQPTVKEIP